jgi:hypothetical protein
MGQGLKLDSRAPWLHKLLFHHFTVQENAVLQTFICSISGVAFTGGFGTYLTGRSSCRNVLYWHGSGIFASWLSYSTYTSAIACVVWRCCA